MKDSKGAREKARAQNDLVSKPAREIAQEEIEKFLLTEPLKRFKRAYGDATLQRVKLRRNDS
jgi:hypothetical protein